MISVRQHLFLIVCFSAVILFTNLGGPKLWDRDEPRKAGTAAEMLQRCDWVTPYFNDELRRHKPVLLYWFIMSAYAVFGVNEFSARFWSAALAVGTALCTYQLGRCLFNARVGLWAAIILSSTLMFDVAGRAATPDSVLVFFTTAAVTVYATGTFRYGKMEQLFPTQYRYVVAMYALMGLAVLAKGPVGLVLPTAVIGMLMLIRRLPERPFPPTTPVWKKRFFSCLRPFAPWHFLKTCWAMRPVTAILVAATIAVPWYAWVGYRTDGEFLRVFFWEHNLSRATSPMEGHDGGIAFYPIAILCGFFPWSVFAGPVLLGLIARVRRRDPWSPGYTLAACWVGVYVVAFTLAQTKLPSYVTPCYPGLALLTGAFIYHWIEGTQLVSPLWTRAAFVVCAAIGAVLLLALPFALARFLPGEQWLAAIGLIPLLGGIAAIVVSESGKRRTAARVFATAALLFTTSMFAVVAQRVSSHQRYQELVDAIRGHSDAPRIAALGALEPTWVFYAGQPVYEFDRSTAVSFLNESTDHFLITRADQYESLRDELPPDARVLTSVNYFLKDEKLIVLGRQEPRMASRPN